MNDMTIRAFIDANVFVASWTADAILTFAEQGFFEPRWTKLVEEEAKKAFKMVHACSTARAERYFAAANRAFPYAYAEVDPADFEGVSLPDPDDAHIVAGAKASNCYFIVTYNLKDFPADALAPHGVRAVGPDEFLMRFAEADPRGAIFAVRGLVAAKKRPPRTMETEIGGLRRNKLDRFADFLASCYGVEERCGS